MEFSTLIFNVYHLYTTPSLCNDFLYCVSRTSDKISYEQIETNNNALLTRADRNIPEATNIWFIIIQLNVSQTHTILPAETTTQKCFFFLP